MSLLWILIAIIGLASPEVVAEPPVASESAPVVPSADEDGVRANIKQIVSAIEACAAVRVDGSYRDTGSGPSQGPDCLSHDEIFRTEPLLAKLDFVDPPAKLEPGHYQVRAVGNGAAGFAVAAAVEEDDSVIEYVETHSPDGTISFEGTTR